MKTILIGLQVATFVALALLFFHERQWRLGCAQVLLALVQAIIYTGRMA